MAAGAPSEENTSNIVSLSQAKADLQSRGRQEKSDEERSGDVLIHVRFYPSAEIKSIDLCPDHLSKKDWFFQLRYAATNRYQTFAGGRGFFRLERSCYEAIL